MTTFQSLNLDPKLLSALESKGYIIPTPIQLQAIPHILEGKDILGIAQTGTGKTAAFSLPILQNLAASNNPVKGGGVRALILTPTRELASQIAENIELYGKDLHLTHAVIFGGVSERPQITTMKRGVDILIATPGRLLDLANQGHIRFMNLEIFVLDEADRMLDMGFINDIKKIIAKIPERRQTLFFSATMPDTIADLANSILKNPAKVEVTPQSTTVDRIDQKINFVEKGNKLSLLKRILKDEDAKSVLVFSKTKHGANRIQEFLEKNSISVAAIHGNKSQGAREKALANFREGRVQVLIATDIAARGIDVPSISHVINYDIPMDPESYVHRIGRTARAGRQGVAISFCDPSENRLLQAVEKTIRFKIPVDTTHAYHGVAASPSSSHDDRPSKPRGQRPNRVSTERGEKSRAANSERRDDRRSSSDRKTREDAQPDGTRSNLLSFIGFGKKRSNDRKQSRGESMGETRDAPFRVKEEEKGGGFGLSWLKNKKAESSSRERAPQPSFTGRDGLPQARDRKPFGDRDRRPAGGSGFGGRDRVVGGSSDRRSGSGFGGGDRRRSAPFGGESAGSRDNYNDNRGNSFNSDNRGNSLGSSTRSDFRAPRERSERSTPFGDRRPSSGDRDRKPFGDRDRKPFGARTGDRDRKPFGDRRPSSGGFSRPKKTW